MEAAPTRIGQVIHQQRQLGLRWLLPTAKRPLLVIVGAVLLLSTILLGLQPIRLMVCGLFRGEAFYHRMPASWWSVRLRGEFDAREAHAEFNHDWTYDTNPAFRWLRRETAFFRGEGPASTELERDFSPKIVPLLVDLLKDTDPRVRMYAVGHLGCIREKAAEAVPALMEMLTDPGVDDRQSRRTVGEEAGEALIWIDPRAAAEAGVREKPARVEDLIVWLKSRRPHDRLTGICYLYQLSYGAGGREIEEAVPELERLLQDPYREGQDYSIGEYADLTLRQIRANVKKKL